jgi:carbamoyltransferase
MIKLSKAIREEYKINNLCMAGGVALNCVANGKILKEKIFDKIWIQPAAGDAGGSLGAALAFWYIEQNKNRKINPNDDMQGSYLGPEYSQSNIEKSLKEANAVFEILNDEEILEKTSASLQNGNAIGWFQGRMEFGPRALGARSILGDPRSPEMQKNLNLKVKFRESFRPFAPSIIFEDISEWFELNEKSPYMLLVANINKKIKTEMTEDQKKLFGIDKLNIKRSSIPAVTHVDYSARVQTVHKETNEKYYKLIQKFKEKTNIPVIVNTSFNIRGEPIVNTPEEAFNCFIGTELDNLVIGNCFLEKKKQSVKKTNNYKSQFELD